jgi:hypothetical protein
MCEHLFFHDLISNQQLVSLKFSSAQSNWIFFILLMIRGSVFILFWTFATFCICWQNKLFLGTFSCRLAVNTIWQFYNWSFPFVMTNIHIWRHKILIQSIPFCFFSPCWDSMTTASSVNLKNARANVKGTLC